MSDLLDFSPPGQTTFTLSGAKARFYNAGTTTLRTVYTDQTETVPHPSPLVADASGRWAQAFVSGGPVKVVVTQADDSTGYTLDPCEKVAAAGAGASQISFAPTVDLPFTNVQAAIEGAAASAASGFTPFGLGVTGSVELLANLDATNIATGQYRFDGTTTGTFPTGVSASDTGAVQVVRETSGSAWMRLYHDTTDRLFVRRMSSSSWGTWREDITANIGATEGDLIYRGASSWTRLAKGTAGQVLQMNSGATAPEWGAGSDIFFRLNSAHAGADVITAQNLFPLSVTLAASTVYEYEIFWSISKTAGATSHTLSTGFGGTATLNNIQRNFAFNGSTTLTYAASFTSAGYLLTANSTLFANAVANATVNYWNSERGTVSINGAGTFIPQYTLSAAPGGAYSTNIGSYFRLRRLGASGSNLSSGSWA